MVEYACGFRVGTDDDRLQVEGSSGEVRFGLRPVERMEGAADVFLTRDAVAALVGQLQSWLVRTEGK